MTHQPPSNQVCAERVIRGILNILCVTRVGPRRFIFTLTKVNTTRRTAILRYSTSQRFDFAVTSVATGREVWRWSFNRVFLPVVEEIRLRPGESTSQSVEWPAVDNFGNPVPSGRYRLRGENLARVTFVERPDGPVVVDPVGQETTDDMNDIMDDSSSAFGAMAKMPVIEVNFEHSDSPVSKAKVISSSSSIPGASIHTVKSGDSLWKIAKQYGTTVDKLKSLNKLSNPNALSIGQKIKLR